MKGYKPVFLLVSLVIALLFIVPNSRGVGGENATDAGEDMGYNGGIPRFYSSYALEAGSGAYSQYGIIFSLGLLGVVIAFIMILVVRGFMSGEQADLAQNTGMIILVVVGGAVCLIVLVFIGVIIASIAGVIGI